MEQVLDDDFPGLASRKEARNSESGKLDHFAGLTIEIRPRKSGDEGPGLLQATG